MAKKERVCGSKMLVMGKNNKVTRVFKYERLQINKRLLVGLNKALAILPPGMKPQVKPAINV